MEAGLGNEAEKPVPMTLKQFLETAAPGTSVSGLSEAKKINSNYTELARPAIQLHCHSEECQGITWFDHKEGEIVLNTKYWKWGIFRYDCRHCQKTMKWFALSAKWDGTVVLALKVGEYPAFGPPLPAIENLVGNDLELFKQGFRAENEGLGMGAHVYYRRVVDNQRARIFDEAIRAAKAVNASMKQIEGLERAKAENRGMLDMSEAVPDSLMIGGENPLELLYKTLSQGIHQHSDADCLEMAKDIRLLLTELAKRIADATENKEEVNSAVQRLLKKKQEALDRKQKGAKAD